MILIHRSSSKPRLLQGVQVLVVDNDRDSRVLYSALLKSYGANIITCASIEESLAVLDWFSPHILLCELRFWGESVETLIAKLNDLERKSGQHLPAIAITTWITDSLVQLLNTGFRGFFLKPIDLDALVSLIKHLVHAKKTSVFAHRSRPKVTLRGLQKTCVSHELANLYPYH